MRFPRVKVINPKDTWLGTECYIDDKKILGVDSVDFSVSVNEIPKFEFEMMGIPEIDMSGEVQFSFTPNTVDEAVKVLRNELLKKGDIYKGFLSSMESAVREQQLTLPYRAPRWIAEDILKRIIGEE